MTEQPNETSGDQLRAKLSQWAVEMVRSAEAFQDLYPELAEGNNELAKDLRSAARHIQDLEDEIEQLRVQLCERM